MNSTGRDEEIFEQFINDSISVIVTGTSDVTEGTSHGLENSTTSLTEARESDLNWWALLTLIVPLLAVFGNLLVILAVRNEPRLQTRTNSFLLSLAVCDSLVALLVIPPSCLALFTGTIPCSSFQLFFLTVIVSRIIFTRDHQLRTFLLVGA